MILLAALFLIGQTAGADILLRVRPHIVVPPESEVKLAQLVDAQQISAEGRHKLESVPVSRAPAYGEQQELSSASLMAVLRSVVDAERARQPSKVHVILPRKIIIDTVKHDLDQTQVAAELTQAWQPLCPDCRLEIDGLSLPRVDHVRDWTLKIKGELPRGTFSVPVDLVRESGTVTPAWISGRLITRRRVPVAARALQQNERVQPADVTWEYRDTSFAYDGVPGADDLTGKRMKQAVRAGDILWLGRLEKEKAVRRGEVVQVHAGSGVFDVSMNVVAQQDAYIGDVVNLKNPKTNAMLTGEVTGQGEVELK